MVVARGSAGLRSLAATHWEHEHVVVCIDSACYGECEREARPGLRVAMRALTQRDACNHAGVNACVCGLASETQSRHTRACVYSRQ